jgi:citrate lyase subunit beta/citryl-CoA lyase
MLYVPANNTRFIDKSHTRGADAIIFDLEDSVPPLEKKQARSMLAESVARAGSNGAEVLVRINRPKTDAYADIEASVVPGVKALMLPKVKDAQHVQNLADEVARLEIERGIVSGQIDFVVMIESPAALFRVEEIVSAHPRIKAAILGGEDFATSAGMTPDPETLFLPKMTVLFAARAAGIAPLGMIGTIADYKDLKTIKKIILRSKKFGFEGASCVHPSVIPLLNKGFTPLFEEVKNAKHLVDAYEQAEKEGIGAIEIAGMMVDVPVADRARALLRRNSTISLKERHK